MKQLYIRLFIAIAALAITVIYLHTGKNAELNNPESYGILKISLSGTKFDIPANYTYGKTMAVFGNWPKGSTERNIESYFTFSLLLPKLIPYSNSDASSWKILGHGDRLEATISIEGAYSGWLRRHRKRYADADPELIDRGQDLYGLATYISKGHESTYALLPLDESIPLAIDCTKDTRTDIPSPSCSVTTNYKSGILLKYYYSKKYLPFWLEIDNKLKQAIRQLESE